jgi:hypothetical protein
MPQRLQAASGISIIEAKCVANAVTGPAWSRFTLKRDRDDGIAPGGRDL